MPDMLYFESVLSCYKTKTVAYPNIKVVANWTFCRKLFPFSKDKYGISRNNKSCFWQYDTMLTFYKDSMTYFLISLISKFNWLIEMYL